MQSLCDEDPNQRSTQNSDPDNLQRRTPHATVPRTLTRGHPGNAGQCSGTGAMRNQAENKPASSVYTPL